MKTTTKFLLLLLTICNSFQSYSQSGYNSKSQLIQCDSLNTLYAYTYLNHGAMFNVVAKTNNIILDHLNANIKNGTFVYYVYYKTGSFLGFEQQPSAWTLIDSVSVTSNNTLTINNQPTVIPINLNLSLNVGDTVALYLTAPLLSRVYLTSTTTPWPNEYCSDTVISISVARSIYQTYGTPFSTPQIWNGSVSYCVGNAVGIQESSLSAEEVAFTQQYDQLIVNIPQTMLEKNNGLQVRLIDFLGKEVLTDDVASSEISIPTSGLTKGVYIGLVTGKSGFLKQQKLVIR